MKLSAIRYSWLVAIFLGATVIGWVLAVIAAERGLPAPVLGTTAMVTLLAVTVLLVVLGTRVLKDRKRPVAQRMNPLAAARTLVLAQSSAYAGALIAGVHAGVLAYRAPVSGMDSTTSIEGLMLCITGLVLTGVGVLVEQWCRVPPDDPHENQEPPPNPENGGYPVAGRNKM